MDHNELLEPDRKTLKPHFLFPASPLDRKMIDETFQDQAIACKMAGFNTSVLDEERRTFGIKPDKDETVVYRGWMMNMSEYSFYTGVMLANECEIITYPMQYMATHWLPEWYPKIEALTPETLIFPNGEMTEWKTTVANGWEKIQVKDYVKSLKTGGGSVTTDAAGIAQIISDMAKFRGTIEGGICLRRFEEFRPGSETRYFVIDGKFYGQEVMFDTRVMDMLIRVARDIPSRFFSVDIAERTDGRYRVVEIGDGQVSDLVGWTPERFAEIWK